VPPDATGPDPEAQALLAFVREQSGPCTLPGMAWIRRMRRKRRTHFQKAYRPRFRRLTDPKRNSLQRNPACPCPLLFTTDSEMTSRGSDQRSVTLRISRCLNFLDMDGLGSGVQCPGNLHLFRAHVRLNQVLIVQLILRFGRRIVEHILVSRLYEMREVKHKSNRALLAPGPDNQTSTAG
jgi:hypothetical protein